MLAPSLVTRGILLSILLTLGACTSNNTTDRYVDRTLIWRASIQVGLKTTSYTRITRVKDTANAHTLQLCLVFSSYRSLLQRHRPYLLDANPALPSLSLQDSTTVLHRGPN